MYHDYSLQEYTPVHYPAYYPVVGLLIGRTLSRELLVNFYPWALSVSDILIAAAKKIVY